MRKGTCEFCELDSAGNHETGCLMDRAGYVRIGDKLEPVIENLKWFRCLECTGLCGVLPSYPFCGNCGAEVPDYLFDYRELYKRAEIDRSFWFALAKELAAVLVTETWEEWGDEHGELLSLPLSPVSPAEILAYYQEGVKREGVDE